MDLHYATHTKSCCSVMFKYSVPFYLGPLFRDGLAFDAHLVSLHRHFDDLVVYGDLGQWKLDGYFCIFQKGCAGLPHGDRRSEHNGIGKNLHHTRATARWAPHLIRTVYLPVASPTRTGYYYV